MNFDKKTALQKPSEGQSRTMNKLSLAVMAVSAALAISQPVLADSTTGTIKGTVIGVGSAATVEVKDTSRGVTKSYDLNNAGEFNARSLPPGTYELKVIEDGVVVDTQTVAVSLGGTVSIYLGKEETVELDDYTVTGEASVPMDTGVAESGLVITTEELNKLPVARDLNSVALLAPGASRGDSAFGDNISFAGASVAENTSYINGLNTTNFRNGLGFSEVPFEFYDTIQVKTGGYSAKYGRSTGGVMNARSKSGSNDFKAGVNYYYYTPLNTAPNTYSQDNDKDEYSEQNGDVWASGALVKDRLFYYALYSHNIVDEEYYGITSGQGYKASEESDFWGLKLDGYITEDHRLEFTAFSDKRTVDEDAYEYDADTSDLGDYIGTTSYERGGTNWIATYIGDLTDWMQLSLSYGENKADRTSAPSTSGNPAIILTDSSGDAYLGNWADLQVEEGEDKRQMVRADLSLTLGDHLVELGLDREKNTATNSTYYSGNTYWRLYPESDLARLRMYENSGEFEVITTAYYLQDTWTVSDKLQVQLGVRNESFSNLNAEGDEFIEIDNQWAPRIAASFDPTGEGKQKFFANAGYYYLPIAANTNIRMSGSELFTEDYYDWNGCMNDDDTPCGLGDIVQSSVFADGSVPDTRSLVDENIEPMYQSEIIAGYEYMTEQGYRMGVKGIYRNLETSIEDVAIDAAVIDYYNSTNSWDSSMVDGASVEDVFGGFHQYVLTNPGNEMKVYIPEQDEYINLSKGQLGYPEAKRTYKAAEFSFGVPFDGKWAADVSYTLAYSKGNNEGYVRSDNGQDDAGITTNFDQPGLLDGGNGYLPNDHRHSIKARGVYELDMGLRFGANFFWQTGKPKSCFGVHPTDGFAAAYGAESFYCNGVLMPRGSVGTTPTVWNLDLSAQYDIALASDHNLQLGVDLFNVLNNSTPTKYRELGERDDGTPDPNYDEVTVYQDPRAIRLSARYQFN